MTWAIVEIATLRLDGWYRDQAVAEQVAAYYAETYPEQRYLIVDFIPRNIETLGLTETGRFDASRKIPAFRKETPGA